MQEPKIVDSENGNAFFPFSSPFSGGEGGGRLLGCLDVC